MGLCTKKLIKNYIFMGKYNSKTIYYKSVTKVLTYYMCI